MKMAPRPKTRFRCACLGCSLIIITGCSRAPDETTALASETPRPSTPVPESTPPPVEVAPPEPDHFDPEGVYFLVGSKSFETADGIDRLTPGTRVVLQPNGTYKDPAGRTILLNSAEVTNDLRIARRVIEADAAAQASLRQGLPPVAEEDTSIYKTSATPAAVRSSPSRSGRAAPARNNPLEQPPHSRTGKRSD